MGEVRPHPSCKADTLPSGTWALSHHGSGAGVGVVHGGEATLQGGLLLKQRIHPAPRLPQLMPRLQVTIANIMVPNSRRGMVNSLSGFQASADLLDSSVCKCMPQSTTTRVTCRLASKGWVIRGIVLA